VKPFLAELKRRKVVRVTIVYVAVGLVVVEAANNLLPALNLPDWTVTLVVALAILGFPVAVALAWAYDITPEGVKRTPALEPGLEEAPSAAVAATPVTERPDELKSIAVLPFADMSPEGDQEYLGDGLAEEVLNVLALLPELRVAARTSSFAFKGKGYSIQEIGRELGVATVLEGSARLAIGYASPPSSPPLRMATISGPRPTSETCRTCSPSRTRSPAPSWTRYG
jgi:adenylate cyclase